MLKSIDKTKFLKYILIYILIFICSFSFSKIGFFGNYFIFNIPFIMFCFLYSKYMGYFSWLISFFCVGIHNKWFYLSFVLVFIFLFFFRYFMKNNKGKLKNIISFSCFILVFIEGIFSLILYDLNMYFLPFLFGVISYWLMRYYYELYVRLNGEESKNLNLFFSAFVLFIVGVVFLGINIKFVNINLSIIGVLLLAFIGGKIGLEIGVLYSFFMIFFFQFYNPFNINIILFFSACLASFLFNKTSKVTFAFMYCFSVFLFLYYNKLSYLEGVDYVIGIILFSLIPNKVINYLSVICEGSEKYIEKINNDNKRMNLEISNKIIKMEEIFSLVCFKVREKGRLKKQDKELLIEEISVFDSLMKKLSVEVKRNIDGNSYYSNVERELYSYGFDLVSFDIKEDLFKNRFICMNVRCNKREINNVIVPIVSRVLRQNLKIYNLRFNEIYGFYEIKLKFVKNINFNFGVVQKAKESNVCGDSYLVYENEEKKIFAISDGMGTGKGAKEKSKETLDLFKKFMNVGFDEAHAIKSINYIVKNGCNKECYSTLDLFVYDKYNHNFYFCKNGAYNSYLVSKVGVKTIYGDELPIGIVDKIEVKKIDVDILSDEYIVMVSDGVSDKKLALLNKIKNKDPQRMAREMMSVEDTLNDDETIIIIRIKNI